MLVVTRFREPAISFRDDLEAALAILAERPGYVSGRLGRNLDEPDLWIMVTEWENVGAYRRALSAHEVKIGAVPLLYHALDEPSAYEPLDGELNRFEARGSGSVL